ncbi:AcrR family transcriptional regulator [Marmoricola sp. OAE513]|uniref:TetR/AcrR family transcriptional regulator n=1 Tax=Marmoricola sp. OAE513 TaxID=2817894 RepID=UPI001AE670FD
MRPDPRAPDASETTRRRRSGEQLAAAILDAAWEEITEAGWSGLRMEAVAARAGVSKASLYERWPSRGLLIRAAMQRQGSSWTLDPEFTGDLETDLLALLTSVAAYLTGPGGEAMRGVASDPVVGTNSIGEERVALVDAVLNNAQANDNLAAGEVPLIVRNAGISLVIEHFLFLGRPPGAEEMRQLVSLMWAPSIRAASQATAGQLRRSDGHQDCAGEG